MSTGNARLESFLSFSSAVTGFSAFRLRGTGQAEAYLGATVRVVGEGRVDELLRRFEGLQKEARDEAARNARLRAEIFSDAELGPIARNIVKLWYVGTWYELPPDWREAFGALEGDRTFVVSPASYVEGLLWPTIGANPPGAKGPGYATWAEPPRIPEL